LARVVLPGRARTRPHAEAAVLAAQPPGDPAAGAVHVVDRPRVSCRHEQAAIAGGVDRVDVEEVKRPAWRRAARRRLRLAQRDVSHARQLELDEAGPDIDLL